MDPPQPATAAGPSAPAEPFGSRTTEFLATLAHELRGPLAPMKQGVQYLRLPHDRHQEARTLDMMERQLIHLGRLVEDLLDTARLSTGKLDLRRRVLDLREVTDHALEISRPELESRHHQLTPRLPPEPLWVDGDPVRLCQVLANLLNNAAKYTPPHGHITLDARRDGGEAVVTVTDDGLGIAPQMLPHIFEIFQQAAHDDGSHDGQGGLGIGLALVRALVGMHGGSVTAHSAGPDQGSTFTVRLPLATATPYPQPQMAQVQEQPGARAAPRPGLRILVVDDNEDAAESLALILQMDGHVARVAHDGQRAIELARQLQPQVAILDIGMPGMDGYELARKLRTLPGPTPLLVALTGWNSDDDLQRARSAGFDHHLAKPADVAQVERLLTQLRAPA